MGDDSATYDEIGNPVSFEFGLADIYINWNGRLVKSVSAGIGPISLVNVTFQYNSDGIRTKKGNTNYYLSGSTIVGEETNGNVTLYIYDANGSILGFKYHPNDAHESSWSTYWYEKNIFGDIVAVYDAFGNKQVSYVYDAWGNTTQIAAANAPTPVLNNPFRYRGYYYDSELYMYYLGSRYYYPAIGRFLSADESSYLGANGDLNSYNLYAYCSNNPVMFTDPSGHSIIGTVILIFCAVVAVAATANDIYQISTSDGQITQNEANESEKIGIVSGDSDIQINNSYKILTPWMQFGYGIYLNHINEDTKDVIKGSTVGFQFEWNLHNIAFFASLPFGETSFKEQAKSVNVGNTIFSDSHKILSTGMRATYLTRGLVVWLIDYLIEQANKES